MKIIWFSSTVFCAFSTFTESFMHCSLWEDCHLVDLKLNHRFVFISELTALVSSLFYLVYVFIETVTLHSPGHSWWSMADLIITCLSVQNKICVSIQPSRVSWDKRQKHKSIHSGEKCVTYSITFSGGASLIGCKVEQRTSKPNLIKHSNRP